jgi:hypothetical protein
MIDVKKLITGFLILAVAATCSGLIFSLVNFSSPAVAANTASGITIGADTAAAGDANAFLPTEAQVQEVSDALAPNLASSTMMVSSTDPSNLTDALATNFVNGVVVANPSGPTGTDADGNPTFNPPDVNALAESIADTTSTQNVSIPDWDIEAESIPITVIATSSNAALTTYGNAITSIINSHLNNNSQVQSIVGDQTGGTSASDLTFVESQVQSALQDVASLKVPTPAVAYQKSLLADLVYEKNLIQLNNLAQTDPVEATLVFQQEDEKFYSVQNNFLDQGQDLASKTISLQQNPPKDQNMFISVLNDVFGISQAHATGIPVVDVVQDTTLEGVQIPEENAAETLQLTDHAVAVGGWAGLFSALSAISVQNMGMRLEAILKNTLLQILKNTLIAIIQREVLTWIQGSGAPRFITNWGTQLVNAAQTSALNAINAQMSCGVFPSFIPQIKLTLNAFYKPGNNSCANQFAAALGSNSFQQFYNNFANGGFVAFGASTLPSGNPYGQQFFSAQTVSLAYNNQQAASQLKAQTSNGFTGGAGSSVCPRDHSDPNGQHLVCESPSQDFTSTNGSCPAGYTQDEYDNNGLCADGDQPIVNTPDAVTGFVLNSANDATPKQIAAATDIVGVLNSVLNSLLTSLASTAVNAAGQLVNQGLANLNSSNITAGSTAPPADLANLASSTSATANTAAPIALTCSPASQTVPSITAGDGTNLLPTPTTTSVSVGDGTTTSTFTTTIASPTVPSNNSPTSLSATGGTFDANSNPPTYSWSDSNGGSGTGASFSDTFANPGTYTVTLTDSAGDAPSTCTVTVQP